MALVGDNGAGKSTLIKCIAGIYRSTRARSLFDGEHGLDPAARRTRPSSGSRSSTRISRSATTSTSSRTCTSAARCATGSSGSEGAGDGERDGGRRCRASRVTTISSIRQPVASLSGGQRQSVAIGARGDVELAASSSSTSRRRRSASPRHEQVLELVKPPRRAGARRRAHLAQPPRHLRGRDRITVLRLGQERRRLRARRRRASRRSSTRSRPVSRRRSRGSPTRTRRRTSRRSEADRRRSSDRTALGRRSAGRRVEGSVRAGDVGVLPVVLGADRDRHVLLLEERRTSSRAGNFMNLMLQMAGVTTIAIGVVFVLLLGEIDLSIGYVSRYRGRRRRRVPAARTRWQIPGVLAIAMRGHRSTALIGFVQGSVRRDNRRAIVRRHACRSAVLAGRHPQRDRRRAA